MKSIAFWVLFQVEFWGLAIVISYEMSFQKFNFLSFSLKMIYFQSVSNSNYWIASIFISLFFEIL